MTQSEINIAISSKPPSQYLTEALNQCNGGGLKYGGITLKSEMLENWKMNCIPENTVNMTIDDYEEFLEERRYLMAQKIKRYFAVL